MTQGPKRETAIAHSGCNFQSSWAGLSVHQDHRKGILQETKNRLATPNGLRADRLGLVLAHFPCFARRAAFASACITWRDVACQHPAPPQLPWLLLPSTEAQEPQFFCLLCKTTVRVILPDDFSVARCCGSFPGGWLVLAVRRSCDYALHNLRTGERVPIPEFFSAADGVGESGVIISAAALSAAPTQHGACLAAVVARYASTIAFWRPGMPHLSPPTPADLQERCSWREMLPRDVIADVVYYSGHGLEGFHVLTDNEEVLVYVPELAADGALTTRLVTYRFPDHRVTQVRDPNPLSTISRYLLDFFGELLMVVRIVTSDVDAGTQGLHAFQLRTTAAQVADHGDRQASWNLIQIPDDAVLFLGRCSSMAFVSPGVVFDGVYFLDDAATFYDVMRAVQAGRLFPCVDMGKRTVSHQRQQIERLFPMRL